MHKSMRKSAVVAIIAALITAGAATTANGEPAASARILSNCSVSAQQPSIAGPYVVALGTWSCRNLVEADFARIYVDLLRWNGIAWERMHLAEYTQHGSFLDTGFTSGARCQGSRNQAYRTHTFGYDSRDLIQYKATSPEITLWC